MKRIGLGIGVSILLMACGSNAESKVSENLPLVKDVETIIKEQGVAEKSEDVVIEEITLVEEVVNKEDIVVDVEIGSKEVANEIIAKEAEENIEVQIPAIIKPSHDTWNSLTKQNVSANGKVNYKGMKEDINQLVLYLSHLNQTPPKDDWTKNERLAYWINLYNASTVYLIASNYPTASITTLSGGKPWDKKFVKSGGKSYTLNQIENEIVRPQFKDPRIHAALNCAAVSCPNLLSEAYLSEKLNNQLNQQCRVWINDSTKNELNQNVKRVSQIFDWYKIDFKSSGGVDAFISKYAIKDTPAKMIKYLEYNWDLNE